MNTKKHNPAAVLLGLAADSKGKFVESIIFAIFGVVAGVIPYFAGANIIVALMNGSRDIHYFGKQCMIALLAYLLKVIFANASLPIPTTGFPFIFCGRSNSSPVSNPLNP